MGGHPHRDLGARYHEADARICLGEAHRSAGDADAARTVWQDGLTILEELGHRDAEKLRAKLQWLDRPANHCTCMSLLTEPV